MTRRLARARGQAGFVRDIAISGMVYAEDLDAQFFDALEQHYSDEDLEREWRHASEYRASKGFSPELSRPQFFAWLAKPASMGGDDELSLLQFELLQVTRRIESLVAHASEVLAAYLAMRASEAVSPETAALSTVDLPTVRRDDGPPLLRDFDLVAQPVVAHAPPRLLAA
jgi:hypothetical protein